MANPQVTIDIIARNAASGVISGLTSQLGALGGIIQNIASGNIAGALSTAIGTIVNETKKAITATLEYGSQIQGLSSIMGVNTEQSSTLIQVASALGITYEELTTSVNNAMKNGFIPSIDVLKKMAEEYQSLPNAMEKSKYATDKFGASSKTMQKILSETPEAIDAVVTSAKELNLIWGDAQIEQIKQYQESVLLLQQSYKSLQLTIGTELVPVLDLLARVFTQGSDAIEDYRIKGAALLLLMGYLSVAQAILGDDTLGLNEKIKALGEQFLALKDNADNYSSGVTSAMNKTSNAVEEATKANKAMYSLFGQISGIERNYREDLEDLNKERSEELAIIGELEQGYWYYKDAAGAVYSDLKGIEKQLRNYRPALDETGESLRDLTERQAELKKELSGYDMSWGQDTRGLKEHREELEKIEQKIKDVEAVHELATRKIVLGYMEQKLAADGILTDEEVSWLIEKGIEWGIYEANTLEVLNNVRSEAETYFKTLHSCPANLNTMITVDAGFTGAARKAIGLLGGGISGGGVDSGRVVYEERAVGGAVAPNTPYLVGENGPEIFKPNAAGSIIPNGQISGYGGGDMDYDRMARAFVEALERSSLVR